VCLRGKIGRQSFDASEDALRERAQVFVTSGAGEGDDQALEEVSISPEEVERLKCRGVVLAGPPGRRPP
jgi:hypothetical protein